MRRRKRGRKQNKALNALSKIIAVIAIIIAIIFCVYVYRLDMLPTKYLTTVFLVLATIYLILSLFAFPKKIKKGLKVFSCILFIIFSLIFGYGIKYVDKTISFIDTINKELNQQEEYKIKCLSDNKITKKELNGKTIGVFKNVNYDKLVERLNKKYKVKVVEYTDAVKLFEDLDDGKIDAIIASDNIYELLTTELDYMKLELITIDSIFVPIKVDKEETKIVNVINTPFNIYIAGGDAYGDINKVMNTDVNMIATVDVKNHKILLTSIPRDYYVVLPSFGENAYDKLTHAGYHGVGESVKAIEKLLDIDINYYAKVNFSTIEKIVDAIGGIDVDSDFSFRFYEPENNMDFTFTKGINHLNGRKALAFARERQGFADGDVQRVKNQQKVISAIINKITSSKTLVSKYTDLLDAISESFATSLDSKSINRIVKAQLNDMRGWDLESQNLVGIDGSSNKCYSIPNINLYVMKQNPESVNTASKKIKDFINREDS